ncbi:peptidylprolyl isomerase [Sandaracinus amylolyticus]|uniref:Peptidyl-prolyl cis-trans isomerase SurA n=1 Tax=Sandaracinus amylolyticus TaxID=927083 RepID=A0A0F6SGD9_9BACT|nr:peptidylprolyl isomerase [Sandaracinus amylolyticus]AKF08524.1 Peptidyl-prolyl cis-trans isomerase SurA [Sandaracinus amylolyticus]
MLEVIQKRFQTVILSILVGLLSATFILTFGGPNSQGCSLNNQGAFAARVYGTTITEGDFRAAYQLVGFQRFDVDRARTLRLRELTMDGLVERELLAHEAERMGFTADSHDVMREVAETGVILSTPPVDAPAGYPGPEIPQSFDDRDGRFSSKNMRRFIQNYLRRSVEEFERWQVRERLAQQTRDAVLATVTVSAQEVREQYQRETDRAQIDYVRFSPVYYRDRVESGDEAIRAWMAEHTEEVDAEYQRQRHRYTGLEEQRRARHILIKATSDAPEADRTAARTRAEELLRRAQAGEDFAALATANSEDTGSARRGGDLGWNARGRMVAPFDEAQFATEPGSITDHVVETNFGYHVIKVEGRREGDVPEDEAKRELAETLYARSRAGELAREQADRALAYLREGNSMQELDTRLQWNWQDAPAAGPDGAAPEAPERDSFAPQVRESRLFGRTDTPVSGTGAGELTRAAFERTMDEPLPGEPIQVGDDWYVFQLKQRTEATEENFTPEVQASIRQQLLEAKQTEVLRAYVHGLRDRARADGELRVNEDVLLYGDEAPEEEEQEEAPAGGDEPEAEPEEEESTALPPRRGIGVAA